MVKQSLFIISMLIFYTNPVLAARQYYTIEAEVIDAVPIMRIEHYTKPHRRCWDEKVTYAHEPMYKPIEFAGPLVGGLIGTFIGNQFGGGSGNVAATVAGGVIGASAGYGWEKQQNEYYAHARRGMVTRCHVSHDTIQEQVITGYQVFYRYDGQVFETYSETFPGDTIWLNVQLTPAR